jgi:hypothetical protein
MRRGPPIEVCTRLGLGPPPSVVVYLTFQIPLRCVSLVSVPVLSPIFLLEVLRCGSFSTLLGVYSRNCCQSWSLEGFARVCVHEFVVIFFAFVAFETMIEKAWNCRSDLAKEQEVFR